MMSKRKAMLKKTIEPTKKTQIKGAVVQ